MFRLLQPGHLAATLSFATNECRLVEIGGMQRKLSDAFVELASRFWQLGFKGEAAVVTSVVCSSVMTLLACWELSGAQFLAPKTFGCGRPIGTDPDSEPI